jgi:hypothetical protein
MLRVANKPIMLSFVMLNVVMLSVVATRIVIFSKKIITMGLGLRLGKLRHPLLDHVISFIFKRLRFEGAFTRPILRRILNL